MRKLAPDAFADVTAIYKMTSPDGSGVQTIRYQDKQHIRVDMNTGANNMNMLKLGDKVYSITGKVVQDMSQLADMMAAMGRGGKGSKVKHVKESQIKYEDTGRTETIAGIEGKVYRFVERGRQHEVVLGKNKDLQDAVSGLMEVSKPSMGMISDENPVHQMPKDESMKSMAMLRLDDDVRLQSMNTNAISDSFFVLPAKPQQMGGLEGLVKRLPRR
ncbi:MAG: hypothetical protein ACE5DZ_03230 [Mariprofundus sp.]